MSTSTTAAIDAVLEQAVASGAVPHVTAIAADRDGVIYEGAAGPRAVGSDDPIGPDTHLRIMSMTKMVATVAALRLAEEGRLDLDAPVATYRPEFADLQVLEGVEGDVVRLRPPTSQATVRQLITHTAGLGYFFFNADLIAWEAQSGTPNVLAGLNASFAAPLVNDPGTVWEYGINTDWLGKVVEAVAGEELDAVVQRTILDPLGMDETRWIPTEAQRANLTPIHGQGEDGTWGLTEIDLNQQPEYWAGGHGLHSTPRDYLKFQRMLLDDGGAVLKPETVDAAFANQIGDIDFPEAIATAAPPFSCDFNAGPGWKWGLGLLLNTVDLPGMRKAYSGSWAGLCNTHFWVDRTSGVTGAIYSQFLPFATPEAYGMYVGFEQALYAGR